MKVEKTNPLRRASGVASIAQGVPGQAAPAASPAAIEDVTSVMGIPETELTPKVRSALLDLMAEVDRLRQELLVFKERVSLLEHEADHDPLLAIANRRAFVRHLSRMMSYAERYGTCGCILYFDLDGLKTLNDTEGHAAGDAALGHVAQLFLENIRESDILGRLGGDEFGVLLAQTGLKAGREKAAILAQKIESSPFQWKEKTLSLSVSYGVYLFESAEDIDSAIEAADKEMYTQKRARKAAKGNPDGGTSQAVDDGR
ncbi:GGDEF domain-containing protein [Rhodospirillaceae bacterium AH-315-P19]|nr:GGDEF domain-containing protein [Rhodospirillaceae bacterium AH-315-P19]